MVCNMFALIFIPLYCVTMLSDENSINVSSIGKYPYKNNYKNTSLFENRINELFYKSR